MSEQSYQTAVRYKPLHSEQSAGYKWEQSLDTLFYPGAYVVEIDHNGANVGLPIADCGEEHYIVGNLVVTDSGTMGPKQNDRVIGQVLTFTSRKDKATKVYSRTNSGGVWSAWRSLAEAGTFENITTTDELLATVASLVDDMGTLTGRGEGSVVGIVEEAVAETNKKAETNSKQIERIIAGDTIAALAHDIYSQQGKADEGSFLKRTTAGHSTVRSGYAELRTVGGAIVKNLISSSAVTKAGNVSGISVENGICEVSASSLASRYGVYFQCEKSQVLSGHKYYVKTLLNAAEPEMFQFLLTDTSNYYRIYDVAGWHNFSFIKEADDATAVLAMYAGTTSAAPSNSSFAFTSPLLVNLTEMFGPGNEPTIEECDAMFATAGNMTVGLNVAAPKEFKSVGFNQCDVSKALPGKTVVDGAIADGANTLVAMPCMPCKLGVGENNGYVIGNGAGSEWSDTAVQAVYFTPFNPLEASGELYLEKLYPQLCEQCNAEHRVYLPACAGYLLIETTDTQELSAHFAWSGDVEYTHYEPYSESNISLPTIPQMSEWGLSGIITKNGPVRDIVDLKNKKYIKRIGRADMGSLAWSYYSERNYFTAIVNGMYASSATSAVCHGYTTEQKNATILDDKCLMTHGTAVYIKDSSHSTASALKTSLQGKYLYYELATPGEYAIDDTLQTSYVASDYGTEEFVGTPVQLFNTGLFYMRSLVGELRNLLDRLYSNFATTDAVAIADRIAAATPATNSDSSGEESA